MVLVIIIACNVKYEKLFFYSTNAYKVFISNLVLRSSQHFFFFVLSLFFPFNIFHYELAFMSVCKLSLTHPLIWVYFVCVKMKKLKKRKKRLKSSRLCVVLNALLSIYHYSVTFFCFTDEDVFQIHASNNNKSWCAKIF